jgi:hypothetical protein
MKQTSRVLKQSATKFEENFQKLILILAHPHHVAVISESIVHVDKICMPGTTGGIVIQLAGPSFFWLYTMHPE